MKSSVVYWLVLCLLGALAAPADNLQFNRDIRPILSDRCFKCHGPDGGSRKAKLRLDDSESAYGPRKNPTEHAIVPGKPDQSLLVQRIFATNADDVMPPAASHLTLSDAEKNTLRNWIAQGAKYEPHWAFVPPPTLVPVPSVKDRKWPRNDIDRFVLARLEQEHIKPSPEASRERWLRRVTYDLIGLPPTPAEIDAFLTDKSPAAYEHVADRLLASPRFGERLAVPWLDAARYADSYGYQSDQLSPTWPYRDWVIDAFNANMPYNEFIKEQLAGDLLPHPTRKQRLATAFNRLHRQTNEGGSVEEEYRDEYCADRVRACAACFMGLTFECARCHDHKFDPISQRDFFSLYSFFNSIDEYGLYNDSPHVPTPSMLLPTAAQEKILTSTIADLTHANSNLLQTIAAADPAFHSWFGDSNIDIVSPGLVAHFTSEALNLTNRPANALPSVRFARAIYLTGDDPITFTNFPVAFKPWSQYTLLFWLHLPETLTNGIIFHCSSGTDTGFHGTQFSLKDGRLFFSIERFWPGNALAVESIAAVPRDQWIQVGVSCDGSGDATGLHLFLNGRPTPYAIVRNHLYKDPECDSTDLNFGARFRSPGLKDALTDDLRVYDRALAPIEVAQSYDGRSLWDAVQNLDADALRPFYLAAISPAVATARAQRADAVKATLEARDPVQETSIMQELPEPRPAFLLARGRYNAPKTDANLVTRCTPSFLPPFPKDAPRNRLGLAEWLTARNHPLTARVAVNRCWQMLFGNGLVTTPENFGAQGSAPTNPALLDWLARNFINSSWDTKALLKKIVLSATYRQDSVLRPDLREKDPENLLLARGPSQRLTAEMIRDTALASSGLLDDKMGGPPVSPYMPGDLWTENNDMSPAYHESVGADLYRRSVYTVVKRTAPMPNMTAFDAPGREMCLFKRTPTSSPQQAFVLLNDTQFVEASRVLAEHTLKNSPETPRRIDFLFRACAGRDPDSQEAKLLADLWAEELDIYTKEPDRAAKLIAVGAAKPDPSLNPVELAAATEVAQAIFNLDATIWKR